MVVARLLEGCSSCKRGGRRKEKSNIIFQLLVRRQQATTAARMRSSSTTGARRPPPPPPGAECSSSAPYIPVLSFSRSRDRELIPMLKFPHGPVPFLRLSYRDVTGGIVSKVWSAGWLLERGQSGGGDVTRTPAFIGLPRCVCPLCSTQEVPEGHPPAPFHSRWTTIESLGEPRGGRSVRACPRPAASAPCTSHIRNIPHTTRTRTRTCGKGGRGSGKRRAAVGFALSLLLRRGTGSRCGGYKMQ